MQRKTMGNSITKKNHWFEKSRMNVKKKPYEKHTILSDPRQTEQFSKRSYKLDISIFISRSFFFWFFFRMHWGMSDWSSRVALRDRLFIMNENKFRRNLTVNNHSTQEKLHVNRAEGNCATSTRRKNMREAIKKGWFICCNENIRIDFFFGFAFQLYFAHAMRFYLLIDIYIIGFAISKELISSESLFSEKLPPTKNLSSPF